MAKPKRSRSKKTKVVENPQKLAPVSVDVQVSQMSALIEETPCCEASLKENPVMEKEEISQSETEYASKGCLKEFSATSRASVKITSTTGKDNIYTFDASATLFIPEGTDPHTVDIDKEFIALFSKLNNQVDDQIQDAEKSSY